MKTIRGLQLRLAIMAAVRWAPAFAGLLLCFPISPSGAQELAPETLLLARIRAKAGENLKRLPNYTCTQTIERSRRNPKARKFEPLDTLRLEVALVEGKELFSWPGAGKFEERGISELVGRGGAIGNGSFALHAKSIFLSHAPTFTYVGETTLNGRRAIRYDYRVPQMLSGYQIRIGPNEAIVEYHGSFWVDADTLDLIRLVVRADNPPPSLNLTEASDTMEYQRAHIGGGDFLLPQSSELVMIDLLGNASRNRTQFSACRQYAGESKLSFVESSPDAAAPAPAPQVKPIRLPPGLRVEVRLQTAIQSGRSATGDPVKALIGRDVKKDGEIVAPKGAVLTGRITRLEKRKGDQDYYIVGLEFSTIEFDSRTGEFRATLQDSGLGQNNRGAPGRGQGAPRRQMMDEDLSGSSTPTGSVFVVRSSHVSLPRGHSMLWRTQLWRAQE
jgi:hypothetical protein